jgi:hypothetical protein
MPNYTPNPKSIEKSFGNVRFQMLNISGYLSAKDYSAARIKADCLIKDTEELITLLKSLPENNPSEND